MANFREFRSIGGYQAKKEAKNREKMMMMKAKNGNLIVT